MCYFRCLTVLSRMELLSWINILCPWFMFVLFSTIFELLQLLHLALEPLVLPGPSLYIPLLADCLHWRASNVVPPFCINGLLPSSTWAPWHPLFALLVVPYVLSSHHIHTFPTKIFLLALVMIWSFINVSFASGGSMSTSYSSPCWLLSKAFSWVSISICMPVWIISPFSWSTCLVHPFA